MRKRITTKKGEKISCKRCGKVVFIAARDLHHGISLRPSLFLSHLGNVLPGKTLVMICPHCGDGFGSVSTEKRVTL